MRATTSSGARRPYAARIHVTAFALLRVDVAHADNFAVGPVAVVPETHTVSYAGPRIPGNRLVFVPDEIFVRFMVLFSL